MSDDDPIEVIPKSHGFDDWVKAAKVQKFLNWKLNAELEALSERATSDVLSTLLYGPDRARWPS